MSKISLCLIVGNVSEYIDRCLTSFAPIADEICVVRAIGNLKPDSTLDIAREKFGAKTSEYLNHPDHDWPHVDNFAAARQQSFDMASGDYCFWCDSDDVLESGADKIRKHASDGVYDCYIFSYRIFGRGIMVPRERLIRRGSGVWESPVHEYFNFHAKPVKAVEDQNVVIVHLPDNVKNGLASPVGSKTPVAPSPDRNLRILRSIPENELTTSHLYHMHTELIHKGDITGAVEASRKALARPDIGTPEKYEIFLNLAQAATTPREKEVLYHQAYMTDPCRREALYLLTNDALNQDKRERGMAYARQMMATRMPVIEDWNARAATYGWAGDDLYCQALRANGKFDEAEAVRLRAMKIAGGPSIALIHATRGRPEQAARCRKIWLDLAQRPDRVEHIFVFDSDDEESQPLSRMHHLQIPAGGGCVAAWNEGVKVTEAPIIVQLSDDWTPPPQWDRLILERIGEPHRLRVLAVSDGVRDDDLLCMAICTRAYWRQDKYLFHPKFTGVYSDDYFSAIAYRRKAVIEARDLVFVHSHPLFGTAAPDKTYDMQNAPERYAEGEKIFKELMSAL